MNAKEKPIVEVIANDVKWLIDNMEATNKHLKEQNGNLAKLWTETMVSKESIKSLERSNTKQWGIIGGSFTIISGSLAIILKIVGVY